MHGEGYRYGAQNEQQLPYVFERVIGILRQRRVARQEASPGVAEHPMVVSDDLTNASFDLRSESFNAQLHRGAIIYVIKASGLNVLLLRATTAYRYVGCRGIVSPPPEFLHASCCTALLGLLCMTARRIPLACAVVGRRSIQASAFAVYAF